MSSNPSSLTSARALAQAAPEPDLDAIHAELLTVISQTGSIQSRQQVADDLRKNIWDGQSNDYRRHEEDTGAKARPFEGAPDERVPVIDTLIRQRTAIYLAAALEGDIQAVPIGGVEEEENAVKTTRVLKWLRKNVLDEELHDELELLASYMEGDDPGVAFLKVWWKRELALDLRELSFEEVAHMLLAAMGVELLPDGSTPPEYAGHMMEAADLLTNKERDADAIAWLQSPGLFPTVEAKTLRRALKELRKEGTTELPVPYVRANRPCVSAGRYMADVFFRSEYDDVQKARVVFEHEWLTESELRTRALSNEWDQTWVENVLQAGPGPGQWIGNSGNLTRTPPQRQNYQGTLNEAYNVYEVFTCYTRASDKFGIEGVYATVYSLHVPDEYGYHGLLGYPHGEMPFIQFRSEHIQRGTENIRGTPQRAGSRQAAIKLQRDSRGAHTMLATVPPYSYHERLSNLEITFGPLVGIPRRDKEDIAMLNMPQFPQASVEMEAAAWKDLALYFGLKFDGVPEDMADVLLKCDVARWLKSMRKVWAHILQLQQAYGDPTLLQLVAGGPMATVTREEIRGKFAVTLTFSPRDANMEFATAKIAAYQQAMALDLGGTGDYSAVFKAAIRGIDPELADQIVGDAAAAQRKQIDDQQGRIGKIAAGIQPAQLQGPSNAQLRSRVLQETLQTSPTLARRYYQPAGPDDELFKEMVDAEAKNLGFLVQQFAPGPENNKAIGQTGAKPVLAPMGGGMQA